MLRALQLCDLLCAIAVALLSNCTGVSHIGAALRTPTVVISMGGEPERWGPSTTSCTAPSTGPARRTFR
jgi:ADP-heptose:LPS heptosyltransferase